MADLPIHGSVASGWEGIGEVFAANFHASENDPGDLGAGLCVVSAGQVVVDLCGGWSDREQTRPFAPDTLTNAYSVGKGISAAITLSAVSRGLIDLDEPIQKWWPEFGQPTTLRHHLTHQAGIPALRGTWPDSLPMDWPGMCAALATTEPWWEPTTAHGYHVNTAGFLVGEPVRRAAGAARFGDLLTEWFATPLGADLMFGVPDEDLARCSEIEFTGGKTPMAPGPVGEFTDEASRMRHHAYFNPSTICGMSIVETAEWRQAEVPSTNIHATAKGVALVYAALLDPSGPVDRELMAQARATQVNGDDLILGKPSRFGLGFQLHQDDRPVGVSPASFGHYGFGGSIGFADPDAGLAVGYVINRPGDRWQIPRTRRLLNALRGQIGISS